jgi:hypothetical protein
LQAVETAASPSLSPLVTWLKPGLNENLKMNQYSSAAAISQQLKKNLDFVLPLIAAKASLQSLTNAQPLRAALHHPYTRYPTRPRVTQARARVLRQESALRADVAQNSWILVRQATGLLMVS